MKNLKTVLCQAAFAIVVLAASAPPAAAGPLKGYFYGDGRIAFTGFTGEIYAALRGPAGILIPANSQPNNPYTLDATLPDEISYLGLSGIHGDLNIGHVVKPSASIGELSQLKMAYQVGFDSQMIEVPFTVVGNVDPTKDSFTPVPEPTASVLILGLGVALVSRQGRRQRGSTGSRSGVTERQEA
jgi:hypothetical protein